MTTNQDSICVGVLLHRLFKILGQVLLVGGILDDRDAKGIMVAQVARLVHAPTKTLDLLNVIDLEHAVFTRTLSLKQESDEHGPVRVSVNTAASSSAGKGGEE
ncbi:hypothetical protein HG530_004825 [Fusarium avenaceum]|nr:hypothetical protein HG530_004825 [Fusarium avenaceum]